MSETVKLTYKDKEVEFPITIGTMGDIGFDISTLRVQTGLITLDIGYKNTGATTSSITFLDGEKGQLMHRGYTIEDLSEGAIFTGVMYLLIYGELPTLAQNEKFVKRIQAKVNVNSGIEKILENFPQTAHPMGILASLTNALTAFENDNVKSDEDIDEVIITLLAQFPVLCAYAYRKNKGLDIQKPDDSLEYVENFYKMMFAEKGSINLDKEVISVLNKLLILHADHEQNCSASTVRMAGSSKAGLFTSVAAGISALWGPLHGGANQAVIEMLEKIKNEGKDLQYWIDKAKDKNDDFRLMGFGHRVYKNFDPRAKIIKSSVDVVLSKLGVEDETVNIAKKLEELALQDPYFSERKLYPNVDFYSGIIYKAMNIPSEMFTVMFALGRLPGWIAQWKEMRSENQPIGRPRQIYIGEKEREFVSIEKR